MCDSELRNHTEFDNMCVLAQAFRSSEINSLCTIMLKDLHVCLHDTWLLGFTSSKTTTPSFVMLWVSTRV